jgi:hypothetical protein
MRAAWSTWWTITAHPRYGFAYGTLPEHAEAGDERFAVELRPEDETVWYDIYAFSRPKGIAWGAIRSPEDCKSALHGTRSRNANGGWPASVSDGVLFA